MCIEVLRNINGKTEILRIDEKKWHKCGARKKLIGDKSVFAIREVMVDSEGNTRVEHWHRDWVDCLYHGIKKN